MLKLSLRNKFILYFSPLIVCIFFLATYSILTFSSIHNHFKKLQRDVTPNAVAMLELKKLLLALESGIKEKRINQNQISSKIEQFKKIISSHADHADTVLDPVAKSSHDTLHRTILTMSLSKYILNQSETGWQDADLPYVSDFIHQELISLGPVLDEHLASHLQELTKTEEFVSIKYQQTLVVVALASVAVIVFTVVMLMALIRSVVRPVKILQAGTKQIGEGNLEYHMEIASGDEFEFLAGEFKKMAAKLSQYHDHLDQKVQAKTKELLDANVELQKTEEQVHFLSQELIKVQETERQQISLDLHDNVAQELSSLKVAGESILEDVAGDNIPLQQEIIEWGKLLDRCIKTVRELSYNLRPPGLEQNGLPSAVFDYCRNFSKQTGITVKFSKAGLDNLQPEMNYAIGINIYRLVQEAFNNIKNHAQANRVDIKLLSSHPNIILRIEDDGQGFDLEEAFQKARQNKRLGLLGMQERVRMVNGNFKIYSAPRKGTKIFITIPLDRDYAGKEKNSDS